MPYDLSRIAVFTACAVAVAAGAVHSTALAQPAHPGQRTAVRQPDPLPQRETLIRLSRPISVEFQEQRLGDVMTFLREYSMAEIEPLWIDGRQHVGLDPETPVTIRAQNITVLSLLERILDQVRDDFHESTWQMSESGAIQIGPRERLNRWKRVVIYDINDLLMEIPDYPDVPRIDLNQALQAGGQGGAGGSPFTGAEGDDREQRERDREERARDIADLIMDVVETEQWVDNGGTGGSLRIFRGNLVVRAPDYMHRGIAGYTWWPRSATVPRNVDGRRYVTMTVDTGISRLAGMAVQPVTGTVGASGGGTGGGAGGGGSTPPPQPPGGGG